MNEYVEILWGFLKLLWPRLPRRARTYRVFLSHDVDEVSLLGQRAAGVVRAMGSDILNRR